MAWLPLVLLLAGCLDDARTTEDLAGEEALDLPVPAPHADPLAAGPLGWTTTDYDLGAVTVGGPDAAHEEYEYESRVRGTLTMPDGDGPFPLAVLLHGQHTTCGADDGSEGTFTCTQPYRNDRGYLYLMEHLASHGVATASILAHEVNQRNGAGDVGMWARGELVLATVDALAAEHGDRLDLSRVGLLGHSRGGEGVVTAVEVNAGRAGPVALAAVVALAPTDFALRGVPGVPFLTLAPYCDGDVYSLHGLRQFDQSRFLDDDAVKVQLLVMGANHNHYNTMWGRQPALGVVPDGDDAPPGRHMHPHCDLPRDAGGGRLSLEDTYAEATLHLAGFLRWTLLDDHALAPYFLGAGQHTDACPDDEPCPGAVHVSSRSPGRRDLFWFDEEGVQAGPGATADRAPVCQLRDCDPNVYSSAWMADLAFDGEATYTVALGGVDLRGTPVLNVRVAVPSVQREPKDPPGLTVAFTDANGTTEVPVDHPALFVPPSAPVDPGVNVLLGNVGGAKVAANAVRLHLPDAVDARTVSSIALRFTSDGGDRVLLADAWMDPDTARARAP